MMGLWELGRRREQEIELKLTGIIAVISNSRFRRNTIINSKVNVDLAVRKELFPDDQIIHV
jgi:hypothetical protein